MILSLLIPLAFGWCMVVCGVVALCKAADREPPEPPAEFQERACASELRPRSSDIEWVCPSVRRRTKAQSWDVGS